jgi:hypothetical protein
MRYQLSQRDIPILAYYGITPCRHLKNLTCNPLTQVKCLNTGLLPLSYRGNVSLIFNFHLFLTRIYHAPW